MVVVVVVVWVVVVWVVVVFFDWRFLGIPRRVQSLQCVCARVSCYVSHSQGRL